MRSVGEYPAGSESLGVNVYLMKYIQNYNLKNMIEDENELHIPYQILLNLSHTNKTFRELILNVKYSFPKINEIMIYYKKNIFIPKLKLELEELNKRKDKIENALYILPIHLNILENKNKKIYTFLWHHWLNIRRL